MERKNQVFISSTYRDLIKEREKVIEGILLQDCIPIGMEPFSTSYQSQIEIVRQLITDCDYFFLILAGKYGSVHEETNISLTEMEFDMARELGKPIFVFYKDLSLIPEDLQETDGILRAAIQKFHEKATNERLARSWVNPDDLKAQVIGTLSKIMSYSEVVTIKEKNKEVHDCIRKNLYYIISTTGYTQSRIIDLCKDDGYIMNPGTMSRFFCKEPKPSDSVIIVPIPILMTIIKKFEITWEELISVDLNKEKYKIQVKTDIKNKDSNFDNKEQPNAFTKNFLKTDVEYINHNSDVSDSFEFINQLYYCYFYQPSSDENNILSAVLEIKNENHICRANFNMNTEKTDEFSTKNHTFMSNYTGYVNFSPKSQCYTCILKDINIEAFSFVSFRYIPLNAKYMDCRIAQVLTTAAEENSFPTIYRMVLSREPLKSNDLEIIMPYLKLSNHRILISKQNFDYLMVESEVYQQILERLFQVAGIEKSYYEFDEKEFFGAAMRLASQQDRCILLSKLRALAVSDKYNKVSDVVEKNVHRYLVSKGYYKS